MKLLLAIVITILAKASLGQNLEQQKKAIDQEVTRISKQYTLKPVSFSIQSLKKVLLYINYQYIENAEGIVKIHRQFSHGKESFEQSFYLKNGGLMFAREKITTHFSSNGKKDSIAWSGDFYFANGKLVDYITLGHGKSEIDSWNPEQDMLTAYRESKRDIARYREKKKLAAGKGEE